MGNRTAKPVNTPTTEPLPSQNDEQSTASVIEEQQRLLRGLNLTDRPTAAVVGAGVVGVHVAWELSKLGFHVTVFDKRLDVADGSSTRYSLPVFGVATLTPSLSTVSVARDLTLGVFPLAAPAIYSVDHAYISFFSRKMHEWLYRRWLYYRQRAPPTSDAVRQQTLALVKDSTDILQRMASDYPTLRSFIRPAETVTICGRRGAGDALAVEGSSAAHSGGGAAYLLDTVSWTRELRRLCSSTKGVDFLLGCTVRPLQSNLLNGKEFVRGVSYDDPTGHLTVKHFDAVVVCSGSTAGSLLQAVGEVPLVPLRGCSVSWSTDNAWSDAVTASLHEPVPQVEPTTPPLPGSDAKPVVTFFDGTGSSLWFCRDGDERRLSGMLSFDTYDATGSSLPKWWARFSAALRLHSGVELPSLPKPESPDGGCGAEAHEFDRTFAPDGLPVVARAGKAFNAFVVGGIDDQLANFAPACAVGLAKLVADAAGNFEGRRQSWAENPWTLDRFPGLGPIRTVDETTRWRQVGQWEENLAGAFDRAKARFGKFVIEMAREDDAPAWLRSLAFSRFVSAENMKHVQEWNEKLASVGKKKSA